MDKKMSDERAEYIAASLDETTQDDAPDVQFRDPIKELGFAKIDHILTLDVDLSDGAYRTYAVLHYYWQNKKSAWPNIETLAKIRDVKESTIRVHLRELADAGLITRERRMGRSSVTYLEELPEKYVENAKLVLSKRQKSSGKSARNLAVSPLVQSPTEEEPLKKNQEEEEPLKSDAKIASPCPDKVPESEVVITKKEHLKAMLSQEPVGNGSAVADPRREQAEYRREVVPLIAAAMGHDEPTPTDKSAATRMWNYRIPIDDARVALKFYANGGGEQYRKPLPNGKRLNGYNLAMDIKEWLANGKPKLSEIRTASDQTRDAIGAMRRLDT